MQNKSASPTSWQRWRVLLWEAPRLCGVFGPFGTRDRVIR
jgi:hypothetical protein